MYTTPKILNRYKSKWPEVKIFFILDLFLTKCVWNISGGVRFFIVPQKPALGGQYWSFWFENWLGHSLSLFYGSCFGSFAPRPSIQWKQWQPRIRRSFSSFWHFSSLTVWWYNLFEWLTDVLSTNSFIVADFLQPWRAQCWKCVPLS
jgi:hypothetical protein